MLQRLLSKNLNCLTKLCSRRTYITVVCIHPTVMINSLLMRLKLVVLKRHCVGVMGKDKQLCNSHRGEVGCWVKIQSCTLVKWTNMLPKHRIPVARHLATNTRSSQWWGKGKERLLHLVGLCADVTLGVFETGDGAVAEAAHHRHQCVEVL